MSDERSIPPDFNQCQTERPNTWPKMPSLMTLGPVNYTRCTNKPAWIGTDGKGSMTFCDECKKVCQNHISGAEFRRLVEPDKSAEDHAEASASMMNTGGFQDE